MHHPRRRALPPALLPRGTAGNSFVVKGASAVPYFFVWAESLEAWLALTIG